MADKPSKRQRRQHLKNVRLVNKGQSARRKHATAQAAAISGGDFLVTLGLVVTSAFILLFLISAFLQYGFDNGGSAGAYTVSSGKQAAAFPPVERSTIEVRVLNGCGTPGASRQVTARLRDLGFDVVVADNAEHFGYQHTLVVDHSDRPEVGREVAGALGCGQLRAQQDEMAMAHVTVILGRDWEKFLGRPAPGLQPNEDWIDRLNGKVQKLLKQ
ncbi:MAG: LytR family transcriptional regulator [Candidatus Glassbacteria bacterium]|nr:LytR family transcriptional regulator [Candidatus Glassbacteria bacterium]